MPVGPRLTKQQTILSPVPTILQGTMKGKTKIDRRRGGTTILRNGQEWILSAQLGQLKTEQGRSNCCEIICGAPTNFQGFGTE